MILLDLLKSSRKEKVALHKQKRPQKSMLKIPLRPRKVNSGATQELFANWPKGYRLTHTPSGACFIPNGSMSYWEIADDREYEYPTYQLETRSVVVDIFTGKEVDIDLSHGDFFGRYARKTFYVR